MLVLALALIRNVSDFPAYVERAARGAIVNVDDLLAALDSGILVGAGLDVLPVEPIPADSRLLGHPNDNGRIAEQCYDATED